MTQVLRRLLSADYVLLMPGVELGDALRYVSCGGTLGYNGGIHASLAARPGDQK